LITLSAYYHDSSQAAQLGPRASAGYRSKDWPTLETAVDTKIEDQAEFVRWWEENVRRAGRKWPDVINAERG
jgi:hypothetical protein